MHRKTVACCAWSTCVFNQFWVLLLWCVLYLNSWGVTQPQEMDMPKKSWTNRPTWIFNQTDGISGSVRETDRNSRITDENLPMTIFYFGKRVWAWVTLLSELSWSSSGLIYFLLKHFWLKPCETGSSWQWQVAQNQRSIFYYMSPQNVKKSQAPPSCDTSSCYYSSRAEGF